MPNNQHSSHSRGRPRAFATLGAMLALSPAPAAGAAENDPYGWRLDPGFDVRLSTYHVHHDGDSSTYPALGASLGLELSAPEQPVAAGLFVDYELATQEEVRNVRLAGGWLRYRLGNLEFTTSAANFAAGNADGTWLYAHKLQLEAWQGHEFAVEAIGSMEDGGKPALQLVYATDLTARISLCVTVGMGPDRMLDYGTSARFAWNIY